MKIQLITLLTLIALLPAPAQAPKAQTPAAATPELTRCRLNLASLDGAVIQWAIQQKRKADDPVTLGNIKPFTFNKAIPLCPAKGNYVVTIAGNRPTCSVHGLALQPNAKAPSSLSRPIPVVEEQTPAQVCRDRLKMLNMAVALYSADERGKLPKDLKTLGDYCSHDITVLSCPGDKPVPPAASKDAKAMKAAWVALSVDKVGYQYTIKPGTPPQAVIRCNQHQHEETFTPKTK